MSGAHDRQPEPQLTHRESFALIVRALRVIAPLWRRVAVKAGLAMLGFLPVLLMPWPAKFILDEVIQGLDSRTQLNAYPFFIAALVDAVHGASLETKAIAVFAFMAATLTVFGAWSTGLGGRDIAYEDPGSGKDMASASE
ncbi:MAG TPA: hypothetical protein VK509_23425, partial [Polyangiales bacterium]|nr:hypothetical protein [Polyangiales bacterium]